MNTDSPLILGIQIRGKLAVSMGKTNSTEPGTLQIFVSYSHKDEELIVSEVEWLKTLDYPVWFDRKISPGITWADELATAIDDSAFIVFYVSSHSIQSPHCLDEIAYALGAGKQVLAVYIQAVELQGGLKLSLSRTQAILQWQMKKSEYRSQLRLALQLLSEDSGENRATTRILAHGTAQQLQKIWQVPLHRNIEFTGREDGLKEIESVLHNATQPVILALTGLGGVGKSQLALEYTYRFMHDNYFVAWIRAESSASIEADFVALATALGLSNTNIPDIQAVIDSVHSWLETNSNWFLILDNVEGPDTLHEFLPRLLRGHVLITSRYQGWGSLARSIALSPFGVNEARDFILNRTGGNDTESAMKLATQLGGLPLALEEACAYMDATGRSIASYLSLFLSHHDALLSRSRPRRDYPDTLQTTWEVSFRELEKTQPSAIRLLNLLAFLGPDDVPKLLLLDSDVPLEGKLPNQIDIDDLVAALKRYSLIKVDHDAISVHRLVQLVTRDRLSNKSREHYAIKALEVIEKAFPASGAVGDMLPDCGRLLPHAIVALAHTDGMTGAEICAAKLLGRTGTYQCARGSLEEGVGQIVKSYQLFLKQGAHSFHFANACELYGRVQYQCGNLDEARGLVEKALDILDQVGDPGSTNIPQCQTLLAWICWSIGDWPAAMMAAETFTEIINRQTNIRDPLTLSGQAITGRLLMDSGDVAKAIEITESCVSVIESLGDARHPVMCSAFMQIAQVFLHAGSPVRARAWAQEALSLGGLAYGKHHPLVAGTHCIMGQVALDFGEFEHAIGEFEATMEYVRQVPTKINQYSAIAGSLMIQTLLKLGREDDIQSLLEEMQLLSINKIAGEAIHFQAHTALAAAQLSSHKGDIDTASSQCMEADQLICSRFGQRHVYRLPFLITRAEVLRTAGLLDDSRALLELGLDIMNENELIHHPQVMACLSALATVSEIAGQQDLARKYRQGKLDGLRACTGPSSPATISAEKELATA